MSTATPLRFELGVRRVKDAAADLPARPPGFTPMTGTYKAVAERAVKLNDVQKGLPKANYIFFADTVGPESNPVHCDICKRIAINEAWHDED